MKNTAKLEEYQIFLNNDCKAGLSYRHENQAIFIPIFPINFQILQKYEQTIYNFRSDSLPESFIWN